MIISTDIQRKNRHKRWKTAIQVAICLGFILGLAIRSFSQPVYDEPDKSNWKQTNGFNIISYRGVRKVGTDTVISQTQLKEHFEALKREGYETISVQDILNFYEKDAKLPDKAVLILFEDGMRDTYLSVQPLLEEYNFKATMMTYAYHLINSDNGALKSSDLSILENSTYWDIGSNGYRYSKINVIEQKNNQGEIVEKYRHYLLDYLRDQDGVPTETKEEMQKRIKWDYDQMNRIYNKALDEEIGLYQIVHQDALFNNINHAVEQVNLENIESIFSLMINREGSCYNSSLTPMYNLTKMSVLPSWGADDLITELNLWTRSNFTYQRTEVEWYEKEGELILDGDNLVLNPDQYQRAFALLKGMEQQQYDIEFYLTENKETTQTLYLRYNAFQKTYIKVSLMGDKLKITERTPDGIDNLLYETLISIEELIDYQDDSLYHKIDTTNMVTPISWKIGLQLEGNKMSVMIAGKTEVLDIDPSIVNGAIALQSIGDVDSKFDELKITIR